MIPGVMAAAKIEAAAPKLRELKKACDGIESNFLKQMLTAMHRTVDAAKPEGDDTGMDDYKDMLDNALADRLAARGTLGISKMTLHATAQRALNETPQGKARP